MTPAPFDQLMVTVPPRFDVSESLVTVAVHAAGAASAMFNVDVWFAFTVTGVGADVTKPDLDAVTVREPVGTLTSV